MDIDDLWIGDRVRLRRSGSMGVYKGQHANGKCRVQVGEKIMLSSIANLEVLSEEEPSALVTLEKEITESSKAKSKSKVPSQIDLHAEAISPTLSFEPPEMILRKQLSVCRSYIQDAIDAKHTAITIIHGKGRGELKKEVDYLLSTFDEIHFSNPINNGGATEVWLR